MASETCPGGSACLEGRLWQEQSCQLSALTHRQQLIPDNLQCWETKALGYLTFLHIKPPPFPRSLFLAFSTHCKCPHKCKILELINCRVLILPSSRENIALPDLQATPLGSRHKRHLYNDIVIFLEELTISV